MEFDQLMMDILVYVSCKFEMYIFKIAQVISVNVRIAFLYVLSIEKDKQGLGTDAIRTKCPPSKPMWEIIKITIRQNTKRTYGKPYDQLSPKTWSLSYINQTKYHLDTQKDTKKQASVTVFFLKMLRRCSTLTPCI